RQMRAPVRSLSGGEKARLLLARIMACESNLLILDEPTNDFDVETLDLLQDILAEYEGTVLLVSHDRDFIDRVATSTVALEGAGHAMVYPGGWSDYQDQRGKMSIEKVFNVAKASKISENPPAKPTSKKKSNLKFTELSRLEKLPFIIRKIEEEIKKLGEVLADASLYSAAPIKFNNASQMMTERQSALYGAEAEWIALEERA
ncbi:MAG: ATP-binding cassette domain-containing protein, partial [Paracoccaceae bacterium]